MQLPSISEIEEMVQKEVERYGREKYGLPRTAIRIILWPGNYCYRVIAGPTALLKVGTQVGDPLFTSTVRDGIDLIARKKAYQRMEIELVSDVMKREDGRRRILRERYNFDEELVPLGIKHTDLSIKTMHRVEVVHRPTGVREVFEFESGKGNIHTATELVKARMARRVAEQQVNVFELPPEHPDWVARTN